jgi:hypothetical protein
MSSNPTGVPDGEGVPRVAPEARAAGAGEGLAGDGAPAGGAERYGPLSLLSLRKADGRALTIYSHPRDEPA